MGSCCCGEGSKDKPIIKALGKGQAKQKVSGVSNKSGTGGSTHAPNAKNRTEHGPKIANKQKQLPGSKTSSPVNVGGSSFSASVGSAPNSIRASRDSVVFSKQATTRSNFSGLKEVGTIGLLDANSSSMLSKPSSIGEAEAALILRLAKLNFHFRDNHSSALFTSQRLDALKSTRLYQDQALKKTVTGESVVPYQTKKLMTQEMVNKARANPESLSAEVRTILVPPFSNMDLVVPGVYLTGFYALTEETIQNENITLIINATNELPLYKSKTILSYRIPVADSDQEPIGLYFDDVADLIEYNRRLRGNSLVHCMAGVSRSTTILLAYLLKYTSLNLHEAFMHSKSIRACIRPNMGFLRQLIDYEIKLNGQSSTKMIECEDKETRSKATVPDFYPSQCPDLFHIELDRQTKRSIH